MAQHRWTETYGVFPHSSALDGSRGYVARPIANGVPMAPYKAIPPLKVYRMRHAAEKYAELLTFGTPRPA